MITIIIALIETQSIKSVKYEDVYFGAFLLDMAILGIIYKLLF